MKSDKALKYKVGDLVIDVDYPDRGPATVLKYNPLSGGYTVYWHKDKFRRACDLDANWYKKLT